MAYILAPLNYDWDLLFEINDHVRRMYFSELATAIFQPFRVHGIVFGTVFLSSLESLSEHLAYVVQFFSREDLMRKVQVTLKQSWDGGIYIHYRAKNKKILDWGRRLFKMKTGRLERFEDLTLKRVKSALDELEADDLSLDVVKRLSPSALLREILEKVWNAGYEYGFLDGEVGI